MSFQMKVKPSGKNITLGCYIESLPDEVPVTFTMDNGFQIVGKVYKEALFMDLIPVETEEGLKFVKTEHITVFHIWEERKET